MPYPGRITARRFSTIVIAVCFLFFTVLIYLPGELYFANVDEFTLRLEDLLLLLLPAFCVAVILCVGLILILPATYRMHFVALAFAIGLLLWIQGNVLLWRYGALDGSQIPWQEHLQNGLIDTPVWIAVFAFSLFAPEIFSYGTRYAAAVIIALQSAMLVFFAFALQAETEAPSARNYVIDQSPKYSFSDTRNVILVVLDAFQSDIFSELVEQDPDYWHLFRGFTYFPNALSAANFTELAIPAMLTGKMYDNSEPRSEYLRGAFLERGVMARLKRSGFVVDIYPWVGWGNESIYFDERVASNLRKIGAEGGPRGEITEAKIKEALHLLDLSVFRSVPHFFKQFVHNDGKWLILPTVSRLASNKVKKAVSTDSEFEINTFVAKSPAVLPTDRGSNVFKYFHFKGLHTPLNVNSGLEFTGDTFPKTKENYKNQAKANLIYLGKFFDKLEDAGIYDKSLILIVSDHGGGLANDAFFASQDGSGTDFQPQGSNRNFKSDRSRAIPIVLVKRFDATGPPTKSESPVSLLDVPWTILSELGFQPVHTIKEPSMFELSPDAKRTRYYSAFDFIANKSDFVGPITIYSVSGHSWRSRSWGVDTIKYPLGAESEADD
jgi:hypothetical protein